MLLKEFIWHNPSQLIKLSTTIPADDSEPVISTSASSPSPASDFLKGIKRDVTQYQEFTDDKKWLLWKRHLKAMAPIHGLECILQQDYKPETEADQALFKQQQNFAFSIFSRCLKTSKSLKFLRDFENTRDAYKLYHALVEAYEGGVTQELHEETVRDQLQKLQLNSAWNRSLESFLVTFEHKLLDLTEITKEPPKDEDKRKWLTAAIRGHEGLYQAATMSKVVLQTTGKAAQAPWIMNIITPCCFPKPKSWIRMQLKPRKQGESTRLSRKGRKRLRTRKPLQQQLLPIRLSLSLHLMKVSQRVTIQKSGGFQRIFGLS